MYIQVIIFLIVYVNYVFIHLHSLHVFNCSFKTFHNNKNITFMILEESLYILLNSTIATYMKLFSKSTF